MPAMLPWTTVLWILLLLRAQAVASLPQTAGGGEDNDNVEDGSTTGSGSSYVDIVSDATELATEWQTELGFGEPSSTSTSDSSSTPAETSVQGGTETSETTELPAQPSLPTPGPLDDVPWQILRSETHPSHCLAIDYEPQTWGPARVIPCSTGGHAINWKFAQGLTQVKSAVNYDGSEWCLDGGEGTDMRLPVTVNRCQAGTASQMWWFTGAQDGHFAMYNQSRCLDLENGFIDDGAHLQTWQCFFGNTNQEWRAEDPSRAWADVGW